jgi:polyisoprenoid-binding protein YceI
MKQLCLGSLALLFMLESVSVAHAKPWAVDYSKSQLGFVGKQGDSPFDGSFAKYQVSIDFDLDHPEKGQISATIDMTSASAGSADRDSYLPQSDWFDTGRFPDAKFV